MLETGWIRILCAMALLPVVLWLAVRTAPSVASVVAGNTPTPGSAYSLLAPTDLSAGQVIRLDPTTLQPRGKQSALHLAHGAGWTSPTLLASQDGAALATVTLRHEYEAQTNAPTKDITIRVFRAISGAQLASFHPKVHVATLDFSLSPDGHALYDEQLDRAGESIGWVELSARTGRVLRSVPVPLGTSCCNGSLVDETHGRLYVVDQLQANTPGSGSGQSYATSPGILRLSAYDLASGRMLRSLTMKDVAMGTWSLDPSNTNDPNFGIVNPGIALSPSGQQLAVLGASDDVLRVIDPTSLQVSATQALANAGNQPTLLGILAGWLGLTPAPALAKEIQGTMLDMHYSRDGSMLLVTGVRATIGQEHQINWTGLGLRIVDPSTGRVITTVLAGSRVNWVDSSPDGSVLYLLSTPADYGGMIAGDTLSRYDLRTRSITAERTFPWSQLVLVPAH